MHNTRNARSLSRLPAPRSLPPPLLAALGAGEVLHSRYYRPVEAQDLILLLSFFFLSVFFSILLEAQDLILLYLILLSL